MYRFMCPKCRNVEKEDPDRRQDPKMPGSLPGFYVEWQTDLELAPAPVRVRCRDCKVNGTWDTR